MISSVTGYSTSVSADAASRATTTGEDIEGHLKQIIATVEKRTAGGK